MNFYCCVITKCVSVLPLILGFQFWKISSQKYQQMFPEVKEIDFIRAELTKRKLTWLLQHFKHFSGVSFTEYLLVEGLEKE